MAIVLAPSRPAASGDKLDHLDLKAAIQFVVELKEPGQMFYPLNGIFSRVKMTCLATNCCVQRQTQLLPS